MKLSIIIPVYNTWQWVVDILESLSSQIPSEESDRKVEILLIDDGSNETPKEIVKEYYEKLNTAISSFEFISVLENRGVSWARNYGLDKATGDYICFIDSDDKIENYYVKTVFENMETGVDYCKYDKYTTPSKQLYMSSRTDLIHDAGVWAWSFTKKCIGKEKFNEMLNVGEDIDWLERVITPEKKGMFSKKVVYWYCWHNNPNSLCKRHASGELKKEKERS